MSRRHQRALSEGNLLCIVGSEATRKKKQNSSWKGVGISPRSRHSQNKELHCDVGLILKNMFWCIKPTWNSIFQSDLAVKWKIFNKLVFSCRKCRYIWYSLYTIIVLVFTFFLRSGGCLASPGAPLGCRGAVCVGRRVAVAARSRQGQRRWGEPTAAAGVPPDLGSRLCGWGAPLMPVRWPSLPRATRSCSRHLSGVAWGRAVPYHSW